MQKYDFSVGTSLTVEKAGLQSMYIKMNKQTNLLHAVSTVLMGFVQFSLCQQGSVVTAMVSINHYMMLTQFLLLSSLWGMMNLRLHDADPVSPA